MALEFIEAKNRKKIGRRELLIMFCALLAIAIELIFPVRAIGESFWIVFVLFFVFPFLAVKFILKESLSGFGFSLGDPRKGIFYAALAIATFLLVSYWLVFQSDLKSQLHISPLMIKNFWYFLWFALCISFPVHFFWEFFFRGFLGLGLEKKLGAYAVLLQAALQSIAYARNSWLMIGLIFLSALTAGFIARKSNSIFYSFAAMWIIAVGLDIMIIRFVRMGTQL